MALAVQFIYMTDTVEFMTVAVQSVAVDRYGTVCVG
jgi:hypothetical protein